VDADSLRRAPALVFSEKDRLQDRWVASVAGEAAARAGFPAHRIASSQGFVDACLAGLGWCLNPEPLVAGALARGDLVELVTGSPLDVALHWQYARLTARALAPLTQAMAAAARSCLLAP
jgi:LysR family transcriptional regulator (chromosome initiation inhibitor)